MTLLEIMIASGIMATAFVLLMGSLASVSATGVSTEERAVAASYVSSILEEVCRTDWDGLVNYQAPGLRGLRGVAATVSIVDAAGGVHPLPLTGTMPSTPNPIEVRVLVTWQGKSGHPYRLAASTLHRW